MWAAFNKLNMTDIADAIGPVEYGMESASCRFICMFLFCIAVSASLDDILTMARFLCKAPATLASESLDQQPKDLWIDFNDPDDGEVKKFWHVVGKTELDYSVFRMSGMPWSWKFIWCWPLVAFRLSVLFGLGFLGSMLLLDTAGIIELILNSLALTFILDIDKIIFAAFSNDMCRDLMGRLEPYQVRVTSEELQQRADDAREHQYAYSTLDLLRHCVGHSPNFIVVMVMVWVMYAIHHALHCHVLMWPGKFLMPWESYFTSPGHFLATPINLIGGCDFWFGRWISKVVSWDGENTCAPYQPPPAGPDGKGIAAVGCGLPLSWGLQ
jgi:hypothetical protein